MIAPFQAQPTFNTFTFKFSRQFEIQVFEQCKYNSFAKFLIGDNRPDGLRKCDSIRKYVRTLVIFQKNLIMLNLV